MTTPMEIAKKYEAALFVVGWMRWRATSPTTRNTGLRDRRHSAGRGPDMRDYTDASVYVEFLKRHPELPKFASSVRSPQ